MQVDKLQIKVPWLQILNYFPKGHLSCITRPIFFHSLAGSGFRTCDNRL